MEGDPKTNFESIKEEMETKGFHYYGVQNLLETNFKSASADGLPKFVTDQVQTKESLINNIKYLPEFTEVRDKLEIEIVRTPSTQESYYIFIKVME